MGSDPQAEWEAEYAKKRAVADKMQADLEDMISPPMPGGPIDFMNRGPFLGCASPFIILAVGIPVGFSHDAAACFWRAAIIGCLFYGFLGATWRSGLSRAVELHPQEAHRVRVPSWPHAIGLTVGVGAGAIITVAMIVFGLRML